MKSFKGVAVIIQPATIRSQSDQWVVLELPKCIVVLPRPQFVEGLKRGKAWKRHAALQARQPMPAS
jgi:hypothetical protein